MNPFQAQNQIEQILSSILPEIGKQIAEKYREDTLEKREAAYQLEEQKLEEQAYQQYLQLSNVIRSEHERAMMKQQQQFKRDLESLSLMETRRDRIEEMKYEQFKERIKQTNIEQLIIRSEEMTIIQKEISEAIEHRYQMKLEQDLASYSKEVMHRSGMKLTKELAAEKKEIEGKIENIGVALKKQVEAEKTMLATLRSKSNIIIKKLNAEKQEYTRKYEVQSVQKQQLYEQLLVRYKELEKQAIESAGIHLKHSFNDNLYSSKQDPHNSNTLFELISEHSSDKEMNSSYQQESTPYISQTNFQTVQIPYSRILDIDVRKYTSNSSQSQNKQMNELSSYIPQKAEESKFQQQYKRELEKMNKKSKLSAVAKSLIVETIIRKGKETGFKFVNLR